MPLTGELLEKQGGAISHFKQDFFCLPETALSAEGAAAFPLSLFQVGRSLRSPTCLSYALHFNDRRKPLSANISNFTLNRQKQHISLGIISAKVPTRQERIFI